MLSALLGKTTNDVFGTFSARPDTFIAMSSTAATQAGANITEPTNGSYARQEVLPAGWTEPTDADPSVSDNANNIDFPTATANWDAAPVIEGVLFDAVTTGNAIGSGTLSASQTILNTEILRVPAGALDISLT